MMRSWKLMTTGTWCSCWLMCLVGSSPEVPISGRHDVPTATYEQLAAEFPEVGRFTYGRPSDAGSCVLIAPQWVLLASHNLMFRTSPAPEPGTSVKEPPRGEFLVEFRGRSYRVDWFRRHTAPLTQPNSADFNYDIALCHLAEPVEDVTPARLYSGDQELGQIVTIVGYGRPGDGVAAVPLTGGTTTKRACQNTIDALGRLDPQIVLDPAGPLLFYDFDNPADVPERKNWFDGHNEPLPNEGMMTTGDSGGGVFWENESGRWLIGLNSGCLGEDGRPTGASGARHTYGLVSRTVRVSRFLDWIAARQTEYKLTKTWSEALIAHWNFELAAEGWVYDASGVGNGAQNNGVALDTLGPRGTWGRWPAEVAGNAEQVPGLRVDNQTQMFRQQGMQVHGDLKLGTDFTWGARLRAPTEPAVCQGLIWGKGADLASADYLWHIADDRLIVQLGSELWSWEWPADSRQTGEWEHWAVCRRAGEIRVYRGGQLWGEPQRSTQSYPISDQPLWIGGGLSGSVPWQADLDDLQIFDRGLSDEEIREWSRYVSHTHEE